MSEIRTVPFVDLYAQYQSIKAEVDAAISDVIANSTFIRGPYIERFESEFSALVGARHCISCANGTDSLYIAMRALGVSPGDEVIVPAHSWISTSETVTQAGGTVVFCDTDARSFTIDTDELVSKITSKTVGIIPVHLFGQPADMAKIMKIASERGLWVIEDCAQAHLATFQGRTVGTFGTIGSFSFYPGKNLGAMGDAGALVTGDSALAERMAMIARHGGLRKGDHQIEGINSRMDGLQAAILCAKLPHLRGWTLKRKLIAAEYSAKLGSVDRVSVPTVLRDREHVFHLYVIRHDERDSLRAHLARFGVDTVVNYPIALPFLPAYRRYGHSRAEFPNAYSAQSACLSLPIFPELSHEQIEYVVSRIAEFH
jgi:dTDP-4-amino-4,6-dideoxygalactose transaminase